MVNKNINPNLLKLAKLTHNPGLKIDISMLSKSEEKEGFEFINNINKKDYIRIPDKNILIAKYEADEFKGLDWQDTHFRLNDNGLFMPSPSLFMPYFVNVIDAYNGKIQLYDGLGNQISKQELEDIYKHLTSDHINSGAWSHLDAKFDENNIETNHRVISGELKGITQPLEDCLIEDCFVDLDFNKQGLAIKKSENQDYKQGENIRYWHPRNGAVAGFDADSDGVGLYWDGGPGGSNSSLGVFACAEGTSKSLRS